MNLAESSILAVLFGEIFKKRFQESWKFLTADRSIESTSWIFMCSFAHGNCYEENTIN